MLTQQQKTRFGTLSRLFAVVLLLFLIAAFSVKDKSVSKKTANQAQQVSSHHSLSTVQAVLGDTVKASFPGGDDAWAQYISGKIYKHLDSLQEAGKAGTTIIAFVVHENGVLSDFKITKMEGTLLAQIVLDAIKNGPKWIPATTNGKKIRSFHKQPVTFQIQEE